MGTMWMREATVADTAAGKLRDLARELPEESGVRGQLEYAAESFGLIALLRGVPAQDAPGSVPAS